MEMDCLFAFTKKRWFLFFSMCFATFASAACAYLQAPFYPREAEKKGSTPSEYGFVFGIYELVGFFICPIYGKYMGRVGALCVLKIGVLLNGVSVILFGLLDRIDDYSWFLTLSYLLRVMESLGSSAILTAVMSIVIVIYPDSYGRFLSIIEILAGMGFVFAPTFGGYLYEIGGFQCPFIVVGVCVCISGLLILLAAPSNMDSDEKTTMPPSSIWSVLKVVPVFLDACCLVVQALSFGFVDAMLEPHLRPFHLSPTMVGSFFVISGVSYTLLSPIVGILCDKHFNTKKMIMFGSLITTVSVLLIGPMPYTPFDTSLWLVGVGLGLLGVGAALMYVPSAVDAINSAIKGGKPDDITTYAVVAGIYASSMSLGGFIGPSMSGLLFDAVGFRKGTLFVVAMNCLLIAAMVWYDCSERNYEQMKETNTESIPHHTGHGDIAATVLAPSEDKRTEVSSEHAPISINTKTKEYNSINTLVRYICPEVENSENTGAKNQ